MSSEDKIDRLSGLVTDVHISVVRLETRVMSDILKHQETLQALTTKIGDNEQKSTEATQSVAKLLSRIEFLENATAKAKEADDRIKTSVTDLQKHVTRADGVVKALGLITALGAAIAVLKGWFR